VLSTYSKRAIAIALGSLLLSNEARSDSWIDVEPAALAYDNLTRAQAPEDRRSDRAMALQVSAGRAFVLSGNDTVDLALDGRGEAYRRYRGLDVVMVGGSASYRHKFGLGADVPWVMASVRGAREDYRDAIRDSNRRTMTVEFGQRLTPRWEAAVGVVRDRRYGDYDPTPEVPGYSARVFDLQGDSVQARVGYAPTDRLLLALQFAVRRGDIESTAQQGYAIYVASDAIAEDPAFNDPALYAYRLRATSYTSTASASYALTGNASVNLTYVENRARAAYSLAYTDRTLALSLAYRYP